jgi:osmotically-inducible protein OsmY
MGIVPHVPSTYGRKSLTTVAAYRKEGTIMLLTHRTPMRFSALIAAAAAAFALTACGQRNDETVGQKVDAAIADARNATAGMRADAKAVANEARQGATKAADAMTSGAKDVTITAKVNAALAADDKLSAIAIDVDTEDGRVSLNGNAPDAQSKARATSLASAVEGVVAVDNRLSVRPRS